MALRSRPAPHAHAPRESAGQPPLLRRRSRLHQAHPTADHPRPAGQAQRRRHARTQRAAAAAAAVGRGQPEQGHALFCARPLWADDARGPPADAAAAARGPVRLPGRLLLAALGRAPRGPLRPVRPRGRRPRRGLA
eukprot:3646998-Prymnesium_polylepis.1